MERECADPGIHGVDIMLGLDRRTPKAAIDDMRRTETLGKRSELRHIRAKASEQQRAVSLVEFDNQPRLDVGYIDPLADGLDKDVWPTRFGKVDFGHDYRRIADGYDASYSAVDGSDG